VPETLAILNCSQLVTLAGARRPRTGGDLRQLSIIEDGAMILVATASMPSADDATSSR